tara:strand:- start:2569 stop:4599 length:2031 start_codon:yes stop_codon:yes gene_type:complete
MISRETIEMKRGFTLVEMLVAMAVTLLMMAALARSFGFVGAKIRDSRADVELSNRLRDVTARLTDELNQCTVGLEPTVVDNEPLGYFMYYEGPVTDATSSLFRASLDADGNTALDDARYGDFDDYLAFTAVAKGNNWFTGKVPRFVLDQKTAQLNGVAYDPVNFPGNPEDPIVIRSKYAEIVYFASPEYQASTLTTSAAYIDADGDTDFDGDMDASENGLPDRIKIHRRVLLIRPDLNLANGRIFARSYNGVPLMRADDWPVGNASTTTLVAGLSPAVLGQAWLYGMAGVHQQCDLSLRRALDANGLPLGVVAANSLADLSKPHNRFGHVRVPHNVLGGAGNTPTSMPVLALGLPPTILNATNGATVPISVAPPFTPSAGPVVTPNILSGFLRPEFVFGDDALHFDSNLDEWGAERRGEDVLTNNALGFDIQVYDPEASFFTTSSNLVVGPSDAGYREALQEAIADGSAAASTESVDDYVTRIQGGFVDLAYPVLAGGSLRGWQPRLLHNLSVSNDAAISTSPGVAGNALDRFFLITPFSGISQYNAGSVSSNAYQTSLYRSGRVVTRGASIRLFQPAFDTYTYHYERDGIVQGYNFGTGTYYDQVGSATIASAPDLGADGIDDNGGGTAYYGSDDPLERETLPPFATRPEAIRITVRIENPATRQIRQASVVHRD